MCRALLVAQGRHPTWRTYSARRVAPGRLLVDQAKKSHLGLYTVLSELSANTKLAWRAVHGRGPAIAVAKSPSHQQSGAEAMVGKPGKARPGVSNAKAGLADSSRETVFWEMISPVIGPLGSAVEPFWAQFGHRRKWLLYLIDKAASYLVRRGGLEPPRDCSR